MDMKGSSGGQWRGVGGYVKGVKVQGSYGSYILIQYKGRNHKGPLTMGQGQQKLKGYKDNTTVIINKKNTSLSVTITVVFLIDKNNHKISS